MNSKGITWAGRLPGFVIDFTVIIFLAFLTANRYCHEFVNADVILNSVMSLQNVTLFYWGQNRVANVLPLLIYPIRYPALNLYACLMIMTIVFYLLVWFWADHLSKSVPSDKKPALIRRLLFLSLILMFLLIFKPYAVFEIVTWHIEYTLSYLLLGVAFFYYFEERKWSLTIFSVTAFCLVFAIGVNYSIIIPALALVTGHIFIERKIDKASLAFSLLATGLFFVWIFISRLYPGGGISYYGFNFTKINEFLPFVARNILDSLNLGNAFIIIIVACLWKLMAFRLSPENALSNFTRRAAYIMMLIVFSIGWILLFSTNTWVVANEFRFRYFTPVLFSGMILLSFEIKNIALFLNTRQSHILSGALVAVLIIFLAHPIVLPHDYLIFKRHDAAIPIDVDGYAGDYWSVWPAVMKDLMSDKNSLGFAYRAVGNRENMIKYFFDNKRRNETLIIGCLKAPVDECHKQITDAIGTLELDHAEPVGKDFWLLKLSR
jgi:hypothetical protein